MVRRRSSRCGKRQSKRPPEVIGGNAGIVIGLSQFNCKYLRTKDGPDGAQ